MAVHLRKSKQRDRIYEMLQSSRQHLTAHWICDALKGEFPHLSLGNVYRNLNILVEQGLANRLSFGSGTDVYEAVREPHYHFVCDVCGTIEDVVVPEELHKSVERVIADRYGHVITRKSVEFHGVCSACQEKRNAENTAASDADERLSS